MKPEPFEQVTRALLWGLDLLFIVLVALAVADATQNGASPWLMAICGGGFLAVYAAGRSTIQTTRAPLDSSRARWWPEITWMAVLCVCWLALLLFSSVALWIAFPLMLLQMHTLGPKLGIAAVAVTTGAAVAESFRDGVHGWSSLGGVLGPIVGGALAVAVVLGLEALARETLQRQRLINELNDTRTYLAEAERERAVLGERERLAREIHDTLAQGFSAIDLLLRAAAPQVPAGPATGLIEQAGETARHNLAEARQFVRALAPADLEGETLVAAIRRATERAAASQEGLEIDFEVVGEPGREPLAVEAALLRITQSALANVTQHASATHVGVVLTYRSGEVALDITDDGIGFTEGAAPSGGGFGLRGVRSRVRELGGTVTITSAPGAGTALSVTLPLDERSTA